MGYRRKNKRKEKNITSKFPSKRPIKLILYLGAYSPEPHHISCSKSPFQEDSHKLAKHPSISGYLLWSAFPGQRISHPRLLQTFQMPRGAWWASPPHPHFGRFPGWIDTAPVQVARPQPHWHPLRTDGPLKLHRGPRMTECGPQGHLVLLPSGGSYVCKKFTST